MIRKLIQCCRPSWFVRYSVYYCLFAMELLSVLLNSMYFVIVGPSPLLWFLTQAEKSHEMLGYGIEDILDKIYQNYFRFHMANDIPFEMGRLALVLKLYVHISPFAASGPKIFLNFFLILLVCFATPWRCHSNSSSFWKQYFFFFSFLFFNMYENARVLSMSGQHRALKFSHFWERFFFVSGIGQRPATM